MDLQHINVKIFVDGELTVDLERFIEIFHEWTAAQSMDELLIDVADYRHVAAGPGIVLVGHEADYAMDNTGNRYGLLYNRKSGVDGSNADRFGQAFRAAFHACQRLEGELDGLKFSQTEFDFFVNDRALAPNTAETYESCRPDLEAFLNETLGIDQFTLVHDDDPRHRFSVRVTTSTPFELATSLQS